MERWVKWFCRTTREAEDAMAKVDLPDWVEEQRRRKWRWCGHVCRMQDGRWTRKVWDWIPDGARLQGRPCSRWIDKILKFLVHCYGEAGADLNVLDALAQERSVWKTLEEDYVNFVESC